MVRAASHDPSLRRLGSHPSSASQPDSPPALASSQAAFQQFPAPWRPPPTSRPFACHSHSLASTFPCGFGSSLVWLREQSPDQHPLTLRRSPYGLSVPHTSDGVRCALVERPCLRATVPSRSGMFADRMNKRSTTIQNECSGPVGAPNSEHNLVTVCSEPCLCPRR